MNTIILVAAGGALGSVARYGLNTFTTRALGEGFPWGILIINVLGSFLMGSLSGYLVHRMPAGESTRLFLATGFLGGFTTFSAFSLDVLKLAQSGQNASALFYVIASVVLTLLAVFIGFAAAKAVLV